MKLYVTFIFIQCVNCLIGQIDLVKKIHFNGKISGELLVNDSIFFKNGLVESKYFERNNLSSKILSNEFGIKTELSYPHMFRIIFFSDARIQIDRAGKYFIDPDTRFISISHSLEECNEVNGSTSEEYMNKFVPFFFDKRRYDCKEQDMEQFIQDKYTMYDSILFEYILKKSRFLRGFVESN